MSEAAPQTAPGQVEVSAGAPAPAATEVAPASGSPATPAAPQTAPAGYVSEDRFNGLMAVMNRQQEQLKALTAAQAAPAAPVVPMVPVPGQDDDLRVQVEYLQQEVLASKMEAAKAEAIKTWPELAPLAKYLQAPTPQDLIDLAQELAESLKVPGEQIAPVPVPTPGEQAPATTVLPSSTTYSPVTDDSIEAAKADVRTNKPGAFGRLMNLMAERQQAAQ